MKLLGNWAYSKITPINFSSNKLIRKIKWKIISIPQHNIYVENSKSGEKTTAVVKKTTREKYSLCEKLLQPYSQK